MATNVGQAYITVTPKFTGFKSAVESELAKTTASGTSSGQKLGNAFSQGATGGLAKSGALVGVFSSITTTALSSITSHLGSAISRFDTLNQYPTVMQTLGYSAESANGSISKMSDRLSTLPTKLDDMASTVQGIAAITGDLDQATNAGLALNDMLIASGSSTQLTTAAMEQFRQMLAKGKPDMQDWRSLVSAMPGQMNQLAQAMLGPTANANDLYAALGGGGAEATITMDELLNKMIELDTDGGGSITSFKEQAETAAGGVATSASNMSNAVTKGIAGVMDEIGKDTISGVFNDMKSAINSAFSVITSAVATVKPALIGLYDAFKATVPSIAAFGAAFITLKTAMNIGSVAAGVVSSSKSVLEAFKLAAGGAGTLGESFDVVGLRINPVGIALTAVSVAAGVLIPKIADLVTKNQNAEKATTALSAAMQTSNFDIFKNNISEAGTAASDTVLSIDELRQKTVELAESIETRNQEAQAQITTLETARQILTDYAGQTDLSTEAQGRLSWAIQEFNDATGSAVTASDVMAGKYQDQNGEVVNLKDSVNELIEAKKNEAKMSALQDTYSEVLKHQQEAANSLGEALAGKNARVQELAQSIFDVNSAYNSYYTYEMAIADATKEVDGDIQKLRDSYGEASSAVSECEQQMGLLSEAQDEASDGIARWVTSIDSYIQSMINSKSSTSDFAQDLESLGVSITDLEGLTSNQLENLANNYDGTALSIVDSLDSMNVGIGGSAREAMASAAIIKDALNQMEGATSGLENAGVNINDFSLKLAEAGISTETLNSIGTENLFALAEECDGDMTRMVGLIEMYNSTPLIDKDGNVVIDDAKLLDAQGNVYTWNGLEIIDKDGKAAVNDTKLTDAQGNLWQWNRSQLEYKSTDGVVNDRMQGAIISRDNWNNGSLRDKYATGRIDIFQNITQTVSRIFGNAAGGFRPHADGGFYQPRYHAGGAIATKAVPLDIVGEAGAEAIVPLTNTKYSRPFAETLAKQMRDMGGSETKVYQFNLDGRALNITGEVQTALDTLVRAAKRQAAMA